MEKVPAGAVAPAGEPVLWEQAHLALHPAGKRRFDRLHALTFIPIAGDCLGYVSCQRLDAVGYSHFSSSLVARLEFTKPAPIADSKRFAGAIRVNQQRNNRRLSASL